MTQMAEEYTTAAAINSLPTDGLRKLVKKKAAEHDQRRRAVSYDDLAQSFILAIRQFFTHKGYPLTADGAKELHKKYKLGLLGKLCDRTASRMLKGDRNEFTANDEEFAAVEETLPDNRKTPEQALADKDRVNEAVKQLKISKQDYEAAEDDLRAMRTLTYKQAFLRITLQFYPDFASAMTETELWFNANPRAHKKAAVLRKEVQNHYD